MAKQSGLGMRWLVGGYDISGDINALDTISGGPAPLDSTDITQEAHSRLGGQRDGKMSASAFMDAANAHPVLAALPAGDVQMMALLPPLTAPGSPVAALNAKQLNYDPTRSSNGDLKLKVDGEANGYGLEWGVALTPGLRTDTTATNGASLDGGAAFTAPVVPASGTPAVNTSPLPASVVVSGGTVTSVVVNGVSVGTGDGTYSVPSGQAITLTYSAAPTWAWTLQTAYGAQAYLQVTGFTGTSVTVTVQESADNATWSTLAAFTAVTAAPAAQRVSAVGTVSRYLRVITTGTFTSATFAVAVMRNITAVSF